MSWNLKFGTNVRINNLHLFAKFQFRSQIFKICEPSLEKLFNDFIRFLSLRKQTSWFRVKCRRWITLQKWIESDFFLGLWLSSLGIFIHPYPAPHSCNLKPVNMRNARPWSLVACHCRLLLILHSSCQVWELVVELRLIQHSSTRLAITGVPLNSKDRPHEYYRGLQSAFQLFYFWPQSDGLKKCLFAWDIFRSSSI